MQVRFEGDSLYKFVSFASLEATTNFICNPTLKFTQKSGLNDPFELTKRWQEFGSQPTREAVGIIIQQMIDEKLNDEGYLIDELLKSSEFRQSGMEEAQVREMLASTAAKNIIAVGRDQIKNKLPSLIDLLFIMMNTRSDEFIERTISKFGILSLTESIDNRALWSLYANSGRGIAVEFDANHPFFVSRRTNGELGSRLHKVFYRDDRIPDFWKNPYYLFCVKHT